MGYRSEKDKEDLLRESCELALNKGQNIRDFVLNSKEIDERGVIYRYLYEKAHDHSYKTSFSTSATVEPRL